MIGKGDRQARVREFLQSRYPETVSISTISRNLKMNRGSVAKYPEVFQSSVQTFVTPPGVRHAVSAYNGDLSLLAVFIPALV